MKTMSFRAAAAEGVALEMRRDPTVYCAGEEITTHGVAYGVSGQGLLEEFGPKRIRNTPIIETAIVGHAVGAAAVGLRPVIELMFMDFLGICLDELGNQAAKMHYMFAGAYRCPMVLRTSTGAVRPAGAHHSQSLEAWTTHVPGLKVVAPSNPADAKGLIISAIRDDNPVVFIEHRGLLGVQGEVPDGDYTIPIGKAEVRRPGTDVTLVAWSAMVPTCIEAAERLAEDGIQAEVIDLRTLIPLDKRTILDSIAKTGRLVIAHEAPLTSGFGAEIAALAADEGFDLLKAPIRRVAAPDVPPPCSPALLKHFVPDAEKIRAAAAAIV
jgi:acetoin:2,6-dichlorophenolindophenol oxidoreductase subunit beta